MPIKNLVENQGIIFDLFKILFRMGYSRKKKKKPGGGGGGCGHIFFENPPGWNFSFFYLTPWNSRQNKAPPLEILQNCVKSLGKFQGQK